MAEDRTKVTISYGPEHAGARARLYQSSKNGTKSGLPFPVLNEEKWALTVEGFILVKEGFLDSQGKLLIDTTDFDDNNLVYQSAVELVDGWRLSNPLDTAEAVVVPLPEGLSSDFDPTNQEVTLTDPDGYFDEIDDGEGNVYWEATAHTGTNHLTLEEDGPNGLKYINNGNAHNCNIQLRRDGGTEGRLSDLVSELSGCIGVIFRTTKLDATSYLFRSDPYANIAHSFGDQAMALWIQDQDFAAVGPHEHLYPDELSWRVAVLRWHGAKMYSRMDGESGWMETPINTGIAAINTLVYLMHSGADNGLARHITSSDGSDEKGDEIFNYLVYEAGF